MQTMFDWLSLALFAALTLLFLQRSVEGESVRAMWKYVPPAIGCAAGNYAGNNGYNFVALFVFSFAVGYSVFVLRPIKWRG